jgi:ABC-type bacteriocin/lantibiotic exporter with double-glycine peptidase domain
MPKGLLAVPHKRQEQPWSCVPACARMLLASLGDEREEAEIARQLRSTLSGTFFKDLARLEEWGYSVSIEQGNLSALDILVTSGFPVIVSVHTSLLTYYPLPPWGAHAIVVVGASRATFSINDPEQLQGGTRVARGAFERAWAMRQHRLATIRPIERAR